MGIELISECDIKFPSGIVGIEGGEEVILDNNFRSVTCFCEKTNLVIDFILNYDKKIIDLKCESKLSNGKCKNINGPRDNEGNLTYCNIIIS